jgi:hypothetical protein
MIIELYITFHPLDYTEDEGKQSSKLWLKTARECLKKCEGKFMDLFFDKGLYMSTVQLPQENGWKFLERLENHGLTYDAGPLGRLGKRPTVGLLAPIRS